MIVYLKPLEREDREQFIKDNQEAFRYGAMEEFGLRDSHFEEDGEIISSETIERSIDAGKAYRIMSGDEKVGGLVVHILENIGELDLLFVAPEFHSKGYGREAWRAVEALYPEVRIWETVTPYFEKRNIHFYVNRCGFHIVEFFNRYHPDPNDSDRYDDIEDDYDGMLRFRKEIVPAGKIIISDDSIKAHLINYRA